MKSLYIMIAAVAAMLFPQTSLGEVNFPIDITFAARGEATAVDEVTVTNLSDPSIAPVTLNGTDILRLVDPSSIPTAIENIQVVEGVTKPILTPNPSMGDGTLIFDAREAGPVRISIYTTDGKLLETATLRVEKGRNTAFIPSQSPGIYLVNIEGKGLKSTARWICGGGKSGSHIALGGAAQWANASLPFAAPWQQGVQTRLQSQANAEGTNVVRMNFHEGDILRFDGTSDGMRTIMHLSPESTHDVFFDFFRCQDVDGYNYPIVRIGDMLWMMEDLHPQKITGLIKTDNPVIWKGMGEYGAGCFVSGDKGFYTVEGGRMAMPEGWEMPSIDEMYALIKELQADSMKVGDFFKDREFDWPLTLEEGLDTIHLQLQPHGFINPEGELAEAALTGAWVTRNTINHGCPVAFEVKATDSRLYPLVIHEKHCAFTVRGCRPAPSVYQEMLQQVFDASEESNEAPRRMPMQLVNSNGPLGSYYTYGADRSSVFFDYTGNQMNVGNTEQRSGVLFKKNGETGWTFESKNLVPTDVNGNYAQRILRKVTAQGNADGYENVVYASWSKDFRVFFDGSTKNKIPEQSSVMGEGIVNITIFGDSIRNHSILNDYATRPLLDKDGNNYLWTMPIFGSSKLSWTMYDNQKYYGDIRSEYFARAFNLRCIQDQTGDGVEEIVMNVGNKIGVFDGVSLCCLRERIYANEGCYIGTPNLRYDVADVTGDGYEDIVIVANTNDIGFMQVYSEGKIDEDPIITKTLASNSLFCDVKVGYLSNSDLPEIAILTRGLRSNSNRQLEKQGYLYVSRLMYDNNLKLTEKTILSKTSVDCFANSDAICHQVCNMDLVFGYFRGREYAQDLIVGDGLWRWDENKDEPTFRFQMIPSTKEGYTIAADAIAAVQASENDKELLVFIWNTPMNQNNSGSYPTVQSNFEERWLGDDGTTVNSNNSFASKVFGWANVGPHFYSGDWVNYETTKWYDYGQGTEINSHPTLCKFTDREQAKHFRFIKHELTFSEPRIYAAIAAAPYYKGLAGSEKAATIWGHEKYDGEGSTSTDTWGGSLIAGYEHSFSMPFFSSAKAGVEFTMKATAAYTKTTGNTETISYGQSYTADTEHRVVMHATPYDTYVYEVVDSDDPDDIGTEFIMSMPRTRRFVGLTIDDYKRLTASQRGVPKPQNYLKGTPGVPSSYPKNYDQYLNGSKKYPCLCGRDLNHKESFEMVGTGGSSTRSLSLRRDSTSNTTVDVGIETELVVTAGGAKVGVGFNYNHSDESVHQFGEDFTVAGTVPGLPSTNDPEHPQFNWNIYWYYVKDEGGVYPVINYAVREK